MTCAHVPAEESIAMIPKVEDLSINVRRPRCNSWQLERKRGGEDVVEKGRKVGRKVGGRSRKLKCGVGVDLAHRDQHLPFCPFETQ